MATPSVFSIATSATARAQIRARALQRAVTLPASPASLLADLHPLIPEAEIEEVQWAFDTTTRIAWVGGVVRFSAPNEPDGKLDVWGLALLYQGGVFAVRPWNAAVPLSVPNEVLEIPIDLRVTGPIPDATTPV